MKEFWHKAFFHLKTKPGRQRGKRKSKGQSLVEFAIALPIIILLFSGLVEFGFILNYYLSLLDATRESARLYSTQDPFNDDLSDNMLYYESAASMVYKELKPINEQDTTRKIILDPDTDDIIITVFNIENTGATNPANVCDPAAPDPEKTITRRPEAGDYRYYGNLTSRITTQDICNQLISGSKPMAILLVEVFYAYHQTIALAPFLPNPVMLHAYTMMPMPPTALSNHTPMVFVFSFPPSPWEN
ncbi:MAG: pilus assembly protein [Chloroflexi bacterium]|nr:pilus assembly protein [Chloroflexota bacterium]